MALIRARQGIPLFKVKRRTQSEEQIFVMSSDEFLTIPHRAQTGWDILSRIREFLNGEELEIVLTLDNRF